MLRSIAEPLLDGENVQIILDAAYAVRGDELLATMDEVRRTHGDNICLLPLSATSAGGGIFQNDKPAGQTVVGIQFSATTRPRVSGGGNVRISDIALDEIVVDAEGNRIYAGSAITLEQLNLALAEQLGPRFKVLGADLTSYTYAQVGATFMTGGMGPQRRYFSDSVSAIALYDGETIKTVDRKQLNGYAGTFGWTGMVTAVCCEYHELPINEIAFSIPVNNNPEDLAKLLAHFAPLCFFNFNQNRPITEDWIHGLEHVTVASMQPYLQSGDNQLIKRAKALSNHCQAAGADGLIFVNAFSMQSADEFLLTLVDDIDAETFTIAGIDLEHTEVFNQPDQMRTIREGIPFAARTQAPAGRYVYKGHTDVVIQVNPDKVGQTVEALWRANEKYVESIESYFSMNKNINGEVLVYGHLNPFGIDPHNRITFACDDLTSYHRTEQYIHQQREVFYRSLEEICLINDAVFIGSEKSAASEAEIFAAFTTLENAPVALKEKFERQIKTIRAASPMFNWRAISPYM